MDASASGKKQIIINKQGTLANDYIFDIMDNIGPATFGERHFSISYKKGKNLQAYLTPFIDKNKYLLQDSGVGSGTFLKI